MSERGEDERVSVSETERKRNRVRVSYQAITFGPIIRVSGLHPNPTGLET